MESKTLNTLDIYKLSIQLSETGWKIYIELTWQLKKVSGDQFLESTDSVGANISEAYGRFHYLDRIKFLYNARGSLYESNYWFDLLNKRNLIKNKELKTKYLQVVEELFPRLNGFIDSIYKKRPTNK